MTDATQVLSAAETTVAMRVPSLYDAKVARLRQILETELDENGDPLWAMADGRFKDIMGLPDRRWTHLWRCTESAVEAFGDLAKRMVEEAQMLQFNVSVRDTGCGYYVATLEAVETMR